MTSLRHDIDVSDDVYILSLSMKKTTDKNKKNTSLRLETKVLKQLKMKALQEGTSIQKIMERLIKDYLKK